MKKVYTTPEVNMEQYELEDGIACITSAVQPVKPYNLGTCINEVSPTNLFTWKYEDNLK